jgi:peroxiredoxin
MDSIAQVGSTAPDFELEDLEGEKHALRDELGSILVLNFWSAECAHSKRSDKAVEELVQEWGDSVSFWCIASNENENDEMLKSAAGNNKIERLLRDRQQEVADAYGAVTTPHVFVIDEMGVLRYGGAFDDVSFRQRTPTRNYLQEAVVAIQKGLDPEPSQTSPFGCAIIRHAL